MFQCFYPRVWADSAYGLPYEKMAEKGIRGLIFDVDNTLAFHNAPADEKAVELFARFRELGLEACLLSNNKEPRVKAFAEAVGAHYVFKGGKPGTKGYRKAMERMGTDRAHTAAVGDQLFTDIWGANRAGIYSILVSPMNPKEEIQIVLKRFLEKPILWAYRRKHPDEPKKNRQKSGRGTVT
ncbi:MAG: YqeG family HAD IIIA-type phosphatase [Lachnospiraceae bacterium]|nr:YqeG family HAD IIIA-type phosphatase [Lachnospiraceae bacterium]